MKITILAVGSEAQYQPTFDTAYQYLKKETAALSAELSYAICRPDAAELFAALRNAMGQSEAVVLLLSPEPAAVSTALRVVCGGLERTAPNRCRPAKAAGSPRRPHGPYPGV